MDKVFIVTSGCYSDYQIEAIFSTREKADAYINAKGTDDDWEVNEWDVDAESTECHDAIYDVSINMKSGCVTVNGRSEQGDGWGYEFDVKRKDCFLYTGHSIRMWLESDSLERVKKVASERWMQIKALHPVVFPYLYEKVVDDRRHFGLPCHEYPMYNFFTKKIILSDTQKLDIRYIIK